MTAPRGKHRGGLGVSERTAAILAFGLTEAAGELAPGNRWVDVDLGEGRRAIVIIAIPGARR